MLMAVIVMVMRVTTLSQPLPRSSSSSYSPTSRDRHLPDLVSQYCSQECVLKEHQLVGVNWLKLLHETDLNGVLADDMGLGKTVQTIAFLGYLKHQEQNRRGTDLHLIVVPASTLSNWQKELKVFAQTTGENVPRQPGRAASDPS